jgi:hypothetical protein
MIAMKMILLVSSQEKARANEVERARANEVERARAENTVNQCNLNTVFK